MRRWYIALLTAITLVLTVSGIALATHQGEGDKVSGRGTSGVIGFEVNAREYTTGAAEGEVHGRVSATIFSGAITVSGDVICVDVEANRATVIGLITEAQGDPSSSGFIGGTLVLSVTDNGRGGDLWIANAHTAPPSPDLTCPALGGVVLVERGNVRVEDNE